MRLPERLRSSSGRTNGEPATGAAPYYEDAREPCDPVTVARIDSKLRIRWDRNHSARKTLLVRSEPAVDDPVDIHRTGHAGIGAPNEWPPVFDGPENSIGEMLFGTCRSQEPTIVREIYEDVGSA